MHFAAHSGSIELVDWLIEELGLDVQQVTKVRLTVAEYIPLVESSHAACPFISMNFRMVIPVFIRQQDMADLSFSTTWSRSTSAIHKLQ